VVWVWKKTKELELFWLLLGPEIHIVVGLAPDLVPHQHRLLAPQLVGTGDAQVEIPSSPCLLVAAVAAVVRLPLLWQLGFVFAWAF
jgi:hypothetical protein